MKVLKMEVDQPVISDEKSLGPVSDSSNYVPDGKTKKVMKQEVWDSVIRKLL